MGGGWGTVISASTTTVSAALSLSVASLGVGLGVVVSVSTVGVGLGVLGFPFISDLSIETVHPIRGVRDDLGSAGHEDKTLCKYVWIKPKCNVLPVRKKDLVLSLHHVAIAGLLSVVVIAVVVLHCVGEVVWHWWTLRTQKVLQIFLRKYKHD